MRRRNPFRYNVRHQNRRRSGVIPLAVVIILLVVTVLALGPRILRGRTLTAAQDLHYESWHPPGDHNREPNADDLAQLQSWLDETNDKLYAGTFPKIRIRWADRNGDAYAYTLNDQISFVRSDFYPEWSGNRDVVLHEMAHVATGRDHDILWDQERARLAEGRRVMTFEQVREASR